MVVNAGKAIQAKALKYTTGTQTEAWIKLGHHHGGSANKGAKLEWYPGTLQSQELTGDRQPVYCWQRCAFFCFRYPRRV